MGRRYESFLLFLTFSLLLLAFSGGPARAAGILGDDGGKEPVVLVHGYMGSIAGVVSVEGYWAYVGTRLVISGYDVHKIVLGEAALQDVKDSAQELKDYVDRVRSKTGKSKVDLVCHSEGGLVARYYVKYLGGAQYVDDFVTIATPHRGTTVAHIGPGEASRQMEVYNDFLNKMNAEWDFPGNIDYTAIHSNHDEIVFPTQNGFFDGAINMNVNLLGHAGILANEFVYQMVEGAIDSSIADNHTAVPIEIVNSKMTTNNPNVTIKFRKANHYWPDANMEEMKVSNNQFLHGAGWESFKSSKSWRLDTTMDGLKAVYVRYQRDAGFLEMDKESPVYVDYIFYDSTRPEASIDVIAKVTLDSRVSVSIDASDNSDNFKKFKGWNALTAFGIEDLGVKEMIISTNSSFSGASWQAYSGSASVNIGTTPGVKTVYLKVRDGAGNESRVVSDTVRIVDPNAGDMGLIAEGDSDPVVLVHGYCGSIVGDVSAYINWVYILEKLKHQGFDVYKIALSDGGLQDVKKSAEELKAFVLDVKAKTGKSKVDIVCHSEGGLVARYFTKVLGGAQYVDDLVTISTPHRGTTVASIGPGEAARQMEVGSSFLKDLNSGETRPGDIEYTALFSHADEIVLPGKNGFFDGAVNVNFVEFGHAGILFHPDPFEVMRNSLVNRYIFSRDVRPVEIDSPGMSTAAGNVSVKIHACNHYAPDDPVTQMMVATNGLFHGASWQPLSKSVNLDISGKDNGLLGVHVKFRGAAGVESPSYADYIMIDRSAPSGVLEITAADSDSDLVAVSIKASDNGSLYAGINPHNLLESYGIPGLGAQDMMVSTNSDFSGASWQAVQGAVTLQVDPGAGRKNVYMKLRDAAGNQSQVYSASTYMFDRVNGYMVMEDDKDPVVFVHGHTGSILGDFSARLYWAYFTEQMADDYDISVITLGGGAWQDIRTSADELQAFVADVLARTGAPKVDLVCHSEGGLVSRYYIKNLGGAAYVDDLITIATPHRGTAISKIALDTAAKQMEVGSDFLADLNGGDATPGTVDYTAIYTQNDEIVIPGVNGFFDGALNINTNLYEHATVILNQEVYDSVIGALSLDIGHEKNEFPIDIVSDSMVTSSQNVTITFNYYNHYAPGYLPDQMMVSNDKFFRGADWQPISSSLNWTLESGDGLKGVYVKYRAAETGTESPSYSDFILLDTTPPQGNVIARFDADDPDYANLMIIATDNADGFATFNPLNPLKSYGITEAGVKEMMIWNTEDFVGASWEPVAMEKKWALAAGGGDKLVHVKFRDGAGIESLPVTVLVKTGLAEEIEDAVDDVVAQLQDFTTKFELDEGWNLVYIGGSLPDRLSEHVTMAVEELDNVIDFSTFNDCTVDGLNVAGNGRALWVHMNDALSSSVSFKAPTSAGRQIPLEEGWNVVGIEGFSTVPVSDLSVTYGGESITVARAAASRIVTTTFLEYDPQQETYVPATELVPFKAYFIKMNAPGVLNTP